MSTVKMVCLVAGFLASGIAAVAEESPSFRTPARRFGAAYSVKVTLLRGGEEYVVPMWIKPDQKISSIDPGQISFTGWNPRDLQAEDVLLALEHTGARTFRSVRSDWAVKPEYPVNCCAGVLGQDILKRYRLRFSPGNPTHIVWTRVGDPVQETRGDKREFEKKLSGMFSIRSGLVRIGSAPYDLSSTAFELDLSRRTLTFDQAPVTMRPGVKTPVFHFEFTPLNRDLDVRGLSGVNPVVARRFGFSIGARVQDLNGTPVSGMTRYEIEEMLRGKKGKILEIGFLKGPETREKSKIFFDFEKNGFTESPSLPASPGRN